jgi:hypothetical protein
MKTKKRLVFLVFFGVVLVVLTQRAFSAPPSNDFQVKIRIEAATKEIDQKIRDAVKKESFSAETDKASITKNLIDMAKPMVRKSFDSGKLPEVSEVVKAVMNEILPKLKERVDESKRLDTGIVRKRDTITTVKSKRDTVIVKSKLRVVIIYVMSNPDVDVKIKEYVGIGIFNAFANRKNYVAVKNSEDFLAEVDTLRSVQIDNTVYDDQASEIAKKFGANFVCVTEITTTSDAFHILTRMIDVQTAKVTSVGNVFSPLKSDADIAYVSCELVRKMTGGAPCRPKENTTTVVDTENGVNTPKVVDTPFFAYPRGNAFYTSDTTVNFYDGKSIYRLEKISGTERVTFVVEGRYKSVVQRFTDDFGSQIGVCNVIGEHNPNASYIKTVEPGEAVFDNDKWIVEKKAKIRYEPPIPPPPPPRIPIMGFSLGYGLSQDADSRSDFLQVGFVYSHRPSYNENMSLSVGGDFGVGIGDYRYRYYDGSNYNDDSSSFSFLSVDVPVTVSYQLWKISFEAGLHGSVLFGDSELLFNAGLVAGLGVVFDERRAWRIFYRYTSGFNYGTHLVGVWRLF